LSEVSVIIDASGHIVVVFLKLILSDNVIRRVIITHIVSDLESFEELLKDLLLSLFSADDIWRFLGVVHTPKIIVVDVSISISVHYIEGLLDDFSAERVHRAADGSQKFIVVDKTRVVIVESTEKCSDFSL